MAVSIKTLILQGESDTLDFKNTISNAAKIAKTLVAFSNNKGGTLLIGVADDGYVKGVKDEEEERYMLLKAANQYCKPAISLSFQEYMLDEKLILIANIPECSDKPYYALDEQGLWWAYIRIKDKSVIASSIIVEVLKNQHKDIEIKYTLAEEKLFQFLKENQQITLQQFSKLTRLPNKKLIKILANLIITGIVKIQNDGHTETYLLAP